MRIVWHLDKVLRQRGLTNPQAAALTGLHPGTISKLRHNPPERVEMRTLMLFCQVLDCQPGELLEYKKNG